MLTLPSPPPFYPRSNLGFPQPTPGGGMLLNLVIVQRHNNAGYGSSLLKPELVLFCGGSYECAARPTL